MRRAATLFALCIAGLARTLVADSYPRQPGIDVLHYVFRVALRDDGDAIGGETTVRFRLLRSGVERIDLDLTTLADGRGMTVSAVTGDAGPLPFVHADGHLRISLPQPALAGSEKSVTIAYSGVPAGGLLIGPNRYGERTFFTQNWPDQAHLWLPVIDHPSDKATGEWIVTAPARYQVVANGLLVEETDLAGGERRTHWSQGVPIPPWLFVIGVARFASHHAGAEQGVELQSWAFPQDRDPVFANFEPTARAALAFYSEHLGPFPYEKLANVEAAGVRGGMENASAIFYGEGSVTTPNIGNIVAHEIAHQWFGDSVTESDWDDVWLSEGFATYCALLYLEHSQGREAFAAGLQASRERVLRAEAAHPGTPVRHTHLTDMSRVLNDLVYQKGAWTLHMLRQEIGDAAFWRGLRAYYQRYRDGNASTAEFRQVMEEASGVELGPFLRQWLDRSGVPKLSGSWHYDAAAKQVELTLEQLQGGDPYRLPLAIALRSPSAAPARRVDPKPSARIERIERIELNTRSATFRFPSAAAPSALVLDPNTELLFDADPIPRRE